MGSFKALMDEVNRVVRQRAEAQKALAPPPAPGPSPGGLGKVAREAVKHAFSPPRLFGGQRQAVQAVRRQAGENVAAIRSELNAVDRQLGSARERMQEICGSRFTLWTPDTPSDALASECRAENQALSAETSALKQEHKALYDTYKATPANQYIGTGHGRISVRGQLASKLRDIDAKVASNARRIDQNNAMLKVHDLAGRRDALQNRLDSAVAAQRDVEGAGPQGAGLQAGLYVVNDARDQLKTTIGERSSRLETAQGELRALQDKRRFEVGRYEQNDTLNDRIVSKQKEVSELKREIRDAKRELRQLDHQAKPLFDLHDLLARPVDRATPPAG